jgi:UDP-glucose 4-epimerase
MEIQVGPVAWVTGATSFLGRHVARQLRRDGFKVVGFSRQQIATTSAAEWGFATIEVGDFEAAMLERVLQRLGAPVAAFHAIGSGSVGQAAEDPVADYERTFKSTEVLTQVLGQLSPATRLIYPSSAAVYGIVSEGAISESAPLNPISEYGKTKLLTEDMCRERAQIYGMQLIVARFFSVYGPWQEKLLLWDIAQRLLSGQTAVTLGGTGRESRDFIHVVDAAAMVVALARCETALGTFNIGTGRATPTMALASKLASAMNSNAEISFTGISRPGDPMHQQADVRRLSEFGQIARVPLEQGLAEYAYWIRYGGQAIELRATDLTSHRLDQ